VYDILIRLPNKHSTGPDGIPAYFYKRLAPVLSAPLAKIFRISLITCQIPSIWLKSFVVPIFKLKGNPSEISNYRPISLLCEAFKVFERVMLRFLHSINVDSLIPPEQHGFRKKYSTATQLVSSYLPIFESFNRKTKYNLILLDVKKAFDTVSHQKLLYKLRALNIPDPLCDWFAVYLCNRTFQVKINNNFSTPCPISSGVPQGSICGPLLFSLYTAELPALSIRPVNSGLFADDNKLGAPATPEGNAALSSTLDRIGLWYEDWQLLLSVEKCSHLEIGAGADNAVANDFSLQGLVIQKVNECRDLGVLVDSKLSFKSHIDLIVKKAFQKSFQIRKSFGTHDAQVLAKLFVAFVRPSLEYASFLWSPHTTGQIAKIERVQRKFTKYILRNTSLSYADRLEALNLRPLSERRSIDDISLLHSFIHHHSPVPDSFKNSVTQITHRTRGNSLRLKIRERPRSDVVKFSWLYRAVRIWNAMPEEMVRANNSLVLKRKLSESLHYLG